MDSCPLPASPFACAAAPAAATPALGEQRPLPDSRPWSVVWVRGEGCPELASLLAEGEARRVGPDLRSSCLDARADLLVARRLTSFDLVSLAVPRAFDPRSVEAVAAGVAGGPHSLLAARIAERLGRALRVPTTLVATSPDSHSDEAAEAALERAAALVPAPDRRLVRAANPGAAIRALPARSLLVLGAPGGTWWRRQFTGPGHQLQVAAPAGAIVVRSAPRRCFQEMGEPVAMGRHMPAGEALRLTTDAVVPVADEGYLVGLARRRTLEAADPSTPLGSLMEPPTSARLEDDLARVGTLAESFAGAPVPVVDAGGRLCGLLDLSPPTPAR